MLVIAVPFMVCVLGLVLMVFGKPNVQRMGEILFFCGLLVTLLHLDAAARTGIL